MSIIKLPSESIKYFIKNQKQIFRSGNLSEGPWNDFLSKQVSNIANIKNAICFNSNGSGLLSLLLVYKEYFGRNKIMIQSNTMYGVKTITKTAGYNLVDIIDCKLETLMPSFEDIKKSLKRNKLDLNKLVILLSDIGGNINPDIVKISNFCKKNNIILLEDAAHSFGSRLNNKFAGTFGDAGVFSFFSTKAIFAGEGGIVVTKNNKVASYLKDFIKYDRFKKKMLIGCNFRLSELQALMIVSVVKEYKKILKNKKLLAKKYIELCKKYNLKYISQEGKFNSGNYYKFIIISDKMEISKLLPKLKTTTSKVYEYSLGKDSYISKRHVCLPIWYKLNIKTFNKVKKEISSSLGS